MEAKEKKVLDAMKKAGQPLRPGEIAEKAAMDKAEVTKIIDKLKKEGESVFAETLFLRAGLITSREYPARPCEKSGGIAVTVPPAPCPGPLPSPS